MKSLLALRTPQKGSVFAQQIGEKGCNDGEVLEKPAILSCLFNAILVHLVHHAAQIVHRAFSERALGKLSV